MEVKKILVTGSEGYIGTVLVEKLIEQEFEVIGVDVLFFGRFNKAKNFRLIKKDIRKIIVSDLKGIYAVVHLAALSNDPMGELNKRLTLDINFKATVRLAKLAKKAGVRIFLFSSSCSVYGIAKGKTVSERSKPNPLTTYARSKVLTEEELKKIADNKFNVGILRFSTLYGFSPSFRNDLVVNNFVTCALATNEIRVMSDGSPWRPLIDVRDLSNVIVYMLKNGIKEINGNVINIGFNENNYQVKKILNEVKKQMKNTKIIFTGEHGKEARSYIVNFDLFKKNFPELSQKWPLSKSIKDLAENLKKHGYSSRDYEDGRHARIKQLIRLTKTSRAYGKKLYPINEK